MTKKLFVFDLDGVLIDSKENMRLSWLKVCKKFKLEVSFDEYFNNIGKPFKVILTDLKIENDQDLIQKEYNNFSVGSFTIEGDSFSIDVKEDFNKASKLMPNDKIRKLY